MANSTAWFVDFSPSHLTRSWFLKKKKEKRKKKKGKEERVQGGSQ
jgi:hypothetical protein